MSVSEPFLLASYNSHLYASANPLNASLAVQSDGVHVIELATLRPIISHTLGPSTSFACSPLTVSDGHVHTIYAPIKSSGELSDEQEHGRTIWVWREDLSSTIADRAEAHKKKVSVTVPHAIAGLLYVPELPNRIIALSPGGAITTLDSDDLQKQKTWISQVDGAGSALLKFFVYPRSECSFLSPVETPRNGVVLVLVLADPTTNDTRVESICIASEDRESPFVLASSYRIHIAQNEIIDVSCSSTGHLSILTASGEWHSFIVKPSEDDPSTLARGADSVQLKNIQFTPETPSKTAALLPLTSTHVLLAGISLTSTEIVIHLWDLQYSVLLVSYILPIPPFSLSSPQTVSIALFPSCPATPSQTSLIDSQALLVISASSQSISKSKSKNKSRSGAVATAVFAVPYVVPRASTIANAMGRAGATAQWITPREDDERNEIGDGIMYSGMDKSRKDVLKEMNDAIEGKRPQSANDAFFKWEKSQCHASDKPLVYGHDFVKQILGVVIQPHKNPSSVMYSSAVVRHLIKQKAVSNSMLEGGLIRALVAKDDWASVDLAMQNVMDITESEIVEALYHIVHACEKQRSPHNPEAMEVDNVTSPRKDTPSVPSFLSCCVKYRITPPQFRQALRQQHTTASAPEHALVILRVLINWLQIWLDHDVMLPQGDKERDEGSQPIQNGSEVPELLKIVSFAQVYLDATFLTLIQHPPAQEALVQLASVLEPEIQFTEAVQPLYGALDEFSRAHRKALRDAEDKSANSSKGTNAVGKHQEDWRQRRKRAREQEGMSIGLYQLEELVL